MTDLQAANRVVGNRVGPKSKVNYRGKLNTIKIYLITREDRNDQHIIPSYVMEQLIHGYSSSQL